MIKLIEKYSFLPPVLDVGCGIGEFIGLLKTELNTKQVYGADFSEEALKMASKKGHDVDNIDLTDRSTFPGTRYSSVICSEVLEHIEDDNLALRNLSELVKPGGKLLVTVPRGEEYMGPHDENVGHLRRYETEEFIKKCKRNYTVLQSLTWGSFLYYIYFKCLRLFPPGEVNKTLSGRPGFVKKTIMELLYRCFFLDDYFVNVGRGPMLFVVMKKT